MKWSATGSERLCSLTNCAEYTSAFVLKENDRRYISKNDAIGTSVFALASFVLCSAVAGCIFVS